MLTNYFLMSYTLSSLIHQLNLVATKIWKNYCKAYGVINKVFETRRCNIFECTFVYRQGSLGTNLLVCENLTYLYLEICCGL